MYIKRYIIIIVKNERMIAMKFGIRTPSLKKSICSRTTGKLKREVKKAVIPGYGKKGMGLLHPKKAVYNKVYHKTTKSIFDIFK